jgi:hypothetical protein
MLTLYFNLVPYNQQDLKDENVQSKRRGSKLHWHFGQRSHFGFFTLHRSREMFLQWGLTGHNPWIDTSTCKEKTEFFYTMQCDRDVGRRAVPKAPLSTRDFQASAVLSMRSSLL